MKTITKKTFIRAPTIVWTVMVLLALSSMIGATVWAEKPANPGKPPSPEPETFDYQIWIGNGPLGSPEDVVLQPYGVPPKDYLMVENVGYSGRWLPPPTKEKKNIEGWSIGLESLDPYGQPGDYCGKYDINNQDLIDALPDIGFSPINDQTVYRFAIQHRLLGQGAREWQRERVDSWFIMIQFENGTVFCPWPEIDPTFMVPYFLVLEGNTDTGLEPEGVYDEDTDTWTISFNEVWFQMINNWDEIEEVWTGQLSFTVNITRTLVQP